MILSIFDFFCENVVLCLITLTETYLKLLVLILAMGDDRY